jgi:hypothetical protein
MTYPSKPQAPTLAALLRQLEDAVWEAALENEVCTAQGMDDGSVDHVAVARAQLNGVFRMVSRAMENSRNIIALALLNGAWGSMSSDEADSVDEVSGVLAELDHAMARMKGSAVV